ncbi:hypothetical protein N781_08835 [Pontibacillus halophilus JSM 076056 = DSM 19796]|uniref:NERD domain-containing protein n=1 Tax=Pontibacillus halophilus JSM 076056 = DSM 19796 TaxID=1385510 RepID=A0A0A5GFT3_9BACI|nr:nuclease-related domain-containing protein [Pontibacillus halophilus]KGX89975.1 hypothetical protein N781_08835 [Pontibacillus halophilus JSM 076056 = DSM 19796]
MGAEIIENFNPNDARTNGERRLLNLFKDNPRFRGWKVFEQPHINSMKPDFVLLHPERGIIIIEVKDWNLHLDSYVQGGFIKDKDSNLHNKNPIQQVENYKKAILKSELMNSVILAEEFEKDYFGVIETVVYFHNTSEDQVNKFCASNKKYTKIWTDKDLDNLQDLNYKLNARQYTYALSSRRPTSKFNQKGLLAELVNELSRYLQYSDYNYERIQPFVLTKSQKDLATLKPGSIRRWSGVAGAGKSLVLAEKAVKALKENQRVLVLSFNITLRHYLRDLCSQQFGQGVDESDRKKLRKDLTILHFHDFLKILIIEHELEGDLEQIEGKDFTLSWINTINKYLQNNSIKSQFNYDYILIDEGQDFIGDWIRFLKQFYTGKGELFVVYDKAQDLYNHGVWIEDTDQVKEIGFKGRPGTLRYTRRLPSEIVKKIQLVRQELQLIEDEILMPEQEQLNLLNSTSWFNYQPVSKEEKISQIVNAIYELRKTNNWEDITVLTTNETTGVSIVEHMQNHGVNVSHVYDMQCERDSDRRRNEKWKFQGGTGRLKISSYHSFKGWQTPNIIMVLDTPANNYNQGQLNQNEKENFSISDALFISLSRVKGKVSTGEYSYTCLNYISEYNRIVNCFN